MRLYVNVLLHVPDMLILSITLRNASECLLRSFIVFFTRTFYFLSSALRCNHDFSTFACAERFELAENERRRFISDANDP